MLTQLIFLFCFISLILASSPVYFSPCSDDVQRNCSSLTNKTNLLLNYKRGGTNILAADSYVYDFFLCEQFNYDCGYMPQANSFVTISNGISLDMSVDQLTSITTLPETEQLIQPYLGAKGDIARCGMILFPLILTSDESKQVLDGYMGQLATNVSVQYDIQRNSSLTLSWTDININIRTAILQKFKTNKAMFNNSALWDKLIKNDFIGISAELKEDYTKSGEQMDLHAAYLIDSVTEVCDKDQSINFLIDESGSIGPAGFTTALNFLVDYVNTTNDDLSKLSINFYDSTYDPYIQYGKTLTDFLTLIPSKNYRGLGTMTGDAMNKTIDLIQSANFSNGIPKVMIIMTDGDSLDSVTEATNRAQQAGITILAVGIGILVNDAQLIQMTGSSSNVIRISGYADLPKLVKFIQNYFCKQIYTLSVGQSYTKNFVKVPSSPSYFRLIKSPAALGQWYELQITYEQDPVAHNHIQYESLIDPFPDSFTQYTNQEYYQIFSLLASEPGKVGAGFVPKAIYYIPPETTIDYTIKKNVVGQMNTPVSYISIGGTNLGFNVSLNPCTTLTCAQQKAKNAPYKKYKNPTIAIIPPAEDLSIFIIIGSTLGVLACLCILFIFAIRRFLQQQEKKKKKNNLPQQIEETLISDYNKEKAQTPYEKSTKPNPKAQILQAQQL